MAIFLPLHCGGKGFSQDGALEELHVGKTPKTPYPASHW